MPQNSFFRDFKKLNRLLSDGSVFCAFDTETTGLYSLTDRIIEIGAVKFDKTGIIATFNALINPDCLIPPACTAINHITNNMVAQERTSEEILPDFLEFIGTSTLLAHNANFDISFLNNELQRSNIPAIKNRTIDTLALSRWAYPLNGKWKLQYLAEQFHIHAGTAHRAKDDARVCMEVFLRCIEDTMSVQQ
jgi:DNA polymerase III subunit epsilon